MIFPILNLLRLGSLILFLLPLYFINRNRAVFLFLRFSGPSFVKLGQMLSTRPDLVGCMLAHKLSEFQDRLPSFNDKKVKKILIAEFGENYFEKFSEFNFNAVASASIAQVHKAKLINGENVAVKILRPNIKRIMMRDIATLRILIWIVSFFSSFLTKTLNDVADLLRDVSRSELDLLQEAANASQLKENLADVKGFYVPKIYWKFSTAKILVEEWLDGIPFSDKEKILQSDFDKKQIAQNLVISYFEQVYGCGFFHADMHPGNLFLLKNGDIAVVDFGIMGRIDKKTRLAIAEILIGFLHKNYRKVAQVHIDAGLVPKTVDVADLTLAIRKIGESIVGNSVKDVSIANLLENLITMTKRYQMNTKPELLLLQKTILLVEGVGVMLDENINIWDLARPWVEEWAKKNIGFDAKIRDALLDFLEATKKFLHKIKG